MITVSTNNFHGYNVKFSPFRENLIACVASQNYGFSGQGALFIVNFDLPQGLAQVQSVYECPGDGLFDVAWSEIDDSILWSACGDGHIQVWCLGQPGNRPAGSVKAHEKEIYGIEWNQVRTDVPSVLSCSWDGTVRHWDASTLHCLKTFLGGSCPTYGVSWSPIVSSTFASVSADGFLRIYDGRQLTSSPSLALNSLVGEALSCDFCKYNEHIVACSGTTGGITIWDTRWTGSQPLNYLRGHSRAVRKIRFDPHQESVIGSVSYDFTTKLWDFHIPSETSNPLLMTFVNHREFAYGLDFNLHRPNLIADCGWDKIIKIFSVTPII